jgi:hypothetical protein
VSMPVYKTYSDLWNDSNKSFEEKIRDISEYHRLSRVSISELADVLKVPVSVAASIIKLDRLSDEQLGWIQSTSLPSTLWSLVGSADETQFASFENQLHLSLAERVKVITNEFVKEQPDAPDSIMSISPATLNYLVKKEEKYKKFQDRSRKAFKQFTGMVASDRTFSAKQVKYFRGLLEELVSLGIVCEKSHDGDQAQCDEVLRALSLVKSS